MKLFLRLALAAAAGLLLLATSCTTKPIEIRLDGGGTTVAPLTGPGGGRDPVVQVVLRARPAVVNVTTSSLQQTAFGPQTGRGVGTGFIIRSDGIVVTNYHVVEGAQRITVITPPPGPERFDARVIGGDPTADLAVLKIDASGLPTVPLGNTRGLQLGQRVVAVGYALALEGGPTVTTGIVSGLDRAVDVPDENCTECEVRQGVPTRTYGNVIQTDAAINPGNSGGPLLDLSGRVVGINTAGAGGQAENIGFAISIDAAKPIVEEAVAHPNEPVAYLGVVTQDVSPSLALQFNLSVRTGAYVVEVSQDGPAERGGIRAGDVIVEFAGERVGGSGQLGSLIREQSPDDRVDVVVATQGGDETKTVIMGVNPLP